MSHRFMFADRRRFLRTTAIGTAGLILPAYFDVPGLFAEELARTPRLTEGPFYPDKLPLDTDNDLIVIKDSTTPAIGEITHLTGAVREKNGDPIKDALVEIWQCDANGVYLHSADSGRRPKDQDKHFQGYGKFETDKAGAYRFRTIKPVAYPGRPAPHIHVKVSRGGKELLTTQLFINGHASNNRDQIFRNVGDEAARKLVLVDFKKVEDSKINELAATFDIVVGATPDERDARERGRGERDPGDRPPPPPRGGRPPRRPGS